MCPNNVLRMAGLPTGRPMSKEAREHRPRSALLTFSLAMMVSAAVLTAALSEPARPLLVQIMPRAPASTGTNFDYLVIILMENHNLCAILPSCYGSDSGDYAVRHNPFVYYSDIALNTSRCNRVVPAGSSDSALIDDLASTSTASNYMWLTPNKCNDIHSCPVETGDAYLADLVQRILSSPVFTDQRAALYITFDEGYGPPVYTAWAGRVVKPQFTSSVAYNHFSLLATVESNWKLQPLTSNDLGATPMTEFFQTPPASDTVPPTITMDVPSNHSSASSTLPVRGSAFDNIAIRAIEVRVDGGPWMPASGTTSWTASLSLAVGNHTIDARATDFAGNQKTVDISLTAQAGIDLVAFLPEIAAAVVVVSVVIVAVLIRRRRKKAT